MDNKNITVNEWQAAHLLSLDFVCSDMRRGQDNRIVYCFHDNEVVQKAIDEYKTDAKLALYVAGLKKSRKIYNDFRREEREKRGTKKQAKVLPERSQDDSE